VVLINGYGYELSFAYAEKIDGFAEGVVASLGDEDAKVLVAGDLEGLDESMLIKVFAKNVSHESVSGNPQGHDVGYRAP
jgi:hypothetical protein